jgi:hypothetical protein
MEPEPPPNPTTHPHLFAHRNIPHSQLMRDDTGPLSPTRFGPPLAFRRGRRNDPENKRQRLHGGAHPESPTGSSSSSSSPRSRTLVQVDQSYSIAGVEHSFGRVPSPARPSYYEHTGHSSLFVVRRTPSIDPTLTSHETHGGTARPVCVRLCAYRTPT